MALPSGSKSKKGSLSQKVDASFPGMDPELLMDIVSKIPRNPVTGKVEMMDIMRYLEENPDDMATLMDKMDETNAVDLSEDLSDFNYASLSKKIKKGDIWVLQMEPNGVVDKNGNYLDQGDAACIPGSKPVFLFYCYVADKDAQYRFTYQHEGLPTSDIVVKVIQKAMADPIPPCKPALPAMLMISIRLVQHKNNLRPFLDSLPKPFSWRFETREEAEEVTDGVWELNAKGYKIGMETAEREKAVGNKAFTINDRQGALKAYEKAIGALKDAAGQSSTNEEEKKIKRMFAVCYSNRAATYLLPGPGLDAKKALDDGESAERIDPGYNKSYVRQAAAYEQLNQHYKAIETITRALRRKELEKDGGLVAKLIELLTNGEGLPDDEGVFKNWILDVMINDTETGDLLSGLDGGWKERIDTHFAKFARKE